MPDDFSGSVSQWIAELKQGDDEAARELWERYFGRLVLVAGRKLRQAKRRVADEEDVALGAFAALCEGAAAGRFDDLKTRDDLWSLLVAIASKKAVDQIRRQTALKRGSGEVRGHSVFTSGDTIIGGGFEQVVAAEPAPEFLAMVDEEHARLLQLLRDDTQRDIVGYRLAGYSNEEIAAKAGISVRSVERKLNLIRSVWAQELNM